MMKLLSCMGSVIKTSSVPSRLSSASRRMVSSGAMRNMRKVSRLGAKPASAGMPLPKDSAALAWAMKPLKSTPRKSSSAKAMA